VGVIGCGGIANGHLRAYRQLPQYEVVAGADPSEAARQRWQTELGVPHMYASAAEMLERERPDVVSLCVWPPLRCEMAELACAAGVKGIWAEKPMAVSLAECDRMLAATERASARMVVNHQRRARDRYVKARGLIEAGAIGDVVQVTGFVGGDLLTGGTHTVDCIRYLLGDPPAEWVIGQIDVRPLPPPATRQGHVEGELPHTRYGHYVESGCMAMIQFRGGARATLEGGVALRRGGGGWPAIIYGTEGMIELSPDRPPEGTPHIRARLKGQAGWSYPEIVPDDGWLAAPKGLLGLLEQGGRHPMDGQAARDVMEITLAVQESARRRARIDLPMAAGDHPLTAMIESGEIALA
jgi:predicted dehydrogenase